MNMKVWLLFEFLCFHLLYHICAEATTAIGTMVLPTSRRSSYVKLGLMNVSNVSQMMKFHVHGKLEQLGTSNVNKA